MDQLWKVDAPLPDNLAGTAETTYTYTPTGQLYQITDATSGVTTYGYNALGQETSVTAPGATTGAAGGTVVYTSYDALGRVLSVTSPLAPGTAPASGYDATTYSYQFGYYDQNNNLQPGMTVTTTLPDPSSGTNGIGPATTDSYDPYGDLMSESAPSATGSGNDTTTYHTSVRVNWQAWILFGRYADWVTRGRDG